MSSVPTFDQLLAFINSLSTTTNSHEWCDRFEASLRVLFPEIDHIITALNLLDRKHLATRLNLTDFTLHPDPAAPLGFTLRALTIGQVADQMEEIIDGEFEREGRSRDTFHPPTLLLGFDDIWVGTLILFRERSKPPFSPATLQTLEAMNRFFVFAFTECNLRHHITHPGDSPFFEAVHKITEQMHLTEQEMRVLMFRLLGRSYKEIGGMLGISPSTVKNHISAVHAKAGVHTQSELFARYFAPQFGLLSQFSSNHAG